MPKFMVNYPNLQAGTPFVNPDGSLTDDSAGFMRTVYEALNANFNSQGTHMPSLETGELGNEDDGAALYNTDTNQFQIRIDGDIHNVTTTIAPEPVIQTPQVNDVNTIENPNNGMVTYDTSDHKLKAFANGGWVNLHL